MEGGTGPSDLILESSKIHQLMTVRVMMCITIDNHWILYAKGYRARSTGARSGVKDGVWVKISQKLLNYNVVGCQWGALQVGSAGE